MIVLFAAALAAAAPVASSAASLLAHAHQAAVETRKHRDDFEPLADHRAVVGRPFHLDMGADAKRLSVVFTDDQLMVRTFMPVVEDGGRSLPYFELERSLAKDAKYAGPNPNRVKIGPATRVEMQYAILLASAPVRDDPDNDIDFIFRAPASRAETARVAASIHVVMDGKIAMLPSKHAAGCAYGQLDVPARDVASAQVCYVGVALSHIAFVDGETGKVLKEWNAPPAKPY